MKVILIALAVVAGLTWSIFYTVGQKERGILFRLGEIVEADLKPGLHLKFPFINNVRKFDSRILTMNARPESFLTVEKKNVTVDFFVKWRISDVGQYYRSTRGDERNAQNRLSQIMKDRLRNEFGKRTIKQVVSGERAEIMGILQEKANKQAVELGINVVDVRISRIDLPDDVSDSVYERMRAERARVAREFRARGRESAERIRANADRQRTEIVATAYGEAEKTRGDGDARSAKIYADAYSVDPKFYSFMRSIEAYKKSFKNNSSVLVLEPDSDFFRYFKDFKGESDQ